MREYLIAKVRRRAWEEEFKQQKLQEMLSLIMGQDLPPSELKAALGHLGLRMTDVDQAGVALPPLAEAAPTEYNDS